MKRLFLAMLAAGALLLVCPAFTSQATATTTTSVSMTFGEPIVPDIHSGCDLRTVTLGGGSITLNETFSNPACPGACRPNPAVVFSGTLTDIVAGGTGQFSGASGNLSGSVTTAGPEAQIRLSGTITLP